MNKIVLFSLCVLATVSVLNAATTKFTTKYDNVNLDEILNNDRLFSKYLDCVLDKPGSKCTPDGLELKNAIPDAIQSECGPCSEKQKEGAKKVIKFIHDKKPKVWDEVMTKYDPQGTYRAKYEKEYKQFLETGTI